MPRSSAVVGCLALVAAASLIATPASHASLVEPDSRAAFDWVEQSPPESPEGRAYPAVAYDSDRGEVIMFGGRTDDPSAFGSDETWSWDGEQWRELDPRRRPEGRQNALMAYDEARNEIVLFGGARDEHTFIDTWIFNGRTWRRARPAQSPPASSRWSMAYDRARAEIVLASGAETWVWNGSTWEDRSSPISPPSLVGTAMAYDPSRQVVVLYGGRLDGNVDDTWLWNGSEWTEVALRRSPPPLSWGSMVTVGRRTLLFGGSTEDGYNDRTWVLGRHGWRAVDATGPAGRSGAGFAYDTQLDEAVLFGGTISDGAEFVLPSDTWVLRR